MKRWVLIAVFDSEEDADRAQQAVSRDGNWSNLQEVEHNNDICADEGICPSVRITDNKTDDLFEESVFHQNEEDDDDAN